MNPCCLYELKHIILVLGTDEERGITKWRTLGTIHNDNGEETRSPVYDIPFIQKYLDQLTITKYIPFCPTFIGCCTRNTSRQTLNRENVKRGVPNEGFSTFDATNVDTKNNFSYGRTFEDETVKQGVPNDGFSTVNMSNVDTKL